MRPKQVSAYGDGPPRVVGGVLVAEASPHTRGWTPDAGVGDRPADGFPAHAGMDP